ncbi:MAG: PPOX class F420-dependent oxidoreductase [Mycobacterium sp.]
MIFEPHEIEYLRSALVGRLATMQPDGTMQNSPIGFSFNEDLGTIDVAGYQMSRSQKFRNVGTNPNVALVVDDIASQDPWRVRCLEIRGTAEQAEVEITAPEQDGAIIRITPRRIISFGIDDLDTPAHQLQTHSRNV